MKRIRSTKLKRLDQIINEDSERELERNRAEMRKTDEEYKEWSYMWSRHREKTRKYFEQNRSVTWCNFKWFYKSTKQAIFGTYEP